MPRKRGVDFVGIFNTAAGFHTVLLRLGVPANQLAETLRTEIGTIEFAHQEAITCSFGIAELIQGETANNLIARADQALYRAKASGRNRVELAPLEEGSVYESAA